MATDGRPFPAELRERALELYAAGVGPAEIGRRLSVPRATVSSWCRRAGVQRPVASERRAAVEAARRNWASRKADLRDETGRVAEETLALCRAAENPATRKAHAITYGVLVDKATLLAGEPTSHVEHSESELHAEVRRLRDELAASDELARHRARRAGP
jgi:hypothetical protein